jgi:hypothetical protein
MSRRPSYGGSDLLERGVIRDDVQRTGWDRVDRRIDVINQVERDLIGLKPDRQVGASLTGDKHVPASQDAIVNVPKPGRIPAIGSLRVDSEQDRR